MNHNKRFKNMIGQRFGKLLVIENSGKKTNSREIIWLCQCDCGNKKEIRGSAIRYQTLSCGCLQKETARNMQIKHDMYKTRIYSIWQDMKRRCNNPNMINYHHYGGRGINICGEWNLFENFYKDMKEGYNDNLSIDRIDNGKGYNKDNCKWSTQEEQMNNTRANRLITFNKNTKTMAQWAKSVGLSRDVLRSRIDKYGWSFNHALTIPNLGR